MVVEQLFTVLTFGQGGAVFQSSRLYTNTVTKGLGNQNAMFKSALQPFKNTSFTQAGRAVTKHPEYFRFDDLASLRKVYNTPDKINRLAADLLKDIMRNGKVTTGAGGRYPGGWKTVTLPDGRAASWHANGDFIGFRGVQP